MTDCQLLPSFASYLSHARHVGHRAPLSVLRDKFDDAARRAYVRGEQARRRLPALEAGAELASMPPESVLSGSGDFWAQYDQMKEHVGRRGGFAPPLHIATPRRDEPHF